MAILLLDCPKTVAWAEAQDFAAAEDRLITAFVGAVGRMPFGNRVQSARLSTDPGRFAATAADIKPVGHMRTVSHLTPEEEADNAAYDAIVERATRGLHD